MESLGQNPAPIASTNQNTEGDRQRDKQADKPSYNELFLCYKCQSHIPYITNLTINASECVITGNCPCGFFFIEEIFRYTCKVEEIQIKENKLQFPKYCNCKKHHKVLNGICKDCEILICDDCVKEDHQIKEEFKKGQSISKINFIYYNQLNLEFMSNLKKYYPEPLKDNYIRGYYMTFFKKVEGPLNLINSLFYTYSLYKDNPQLMHNFYYVQFFTN